uniref:Uncharacterized protein n=1 Tax=Anguilla anguilla TaxID=7936 RepID=A0A0E9W3F4_ANGAN
MFLGLGFFGGVFLLLHFRLLTNECKVCSCFTATISGTITFKP